MFFLLNPRQAGKTFLAKNIQEEFKKSICLNNNDPVSFTAVAAL